MGSKGRGPPPMYRGPHPGHGMMHPDPYGPGVCPPPGAYPPYDMLPPPEVLEQKLSIQHMELQRLAAENQHLSATHMALRQELGVAQQELQRVQAQVGGIKHEKEQQMQGLMEKIAKMEADLQAAESIKIELQKAQADAQSLTAARQELINKVQQLTHDHQRTFADVQQVPALMSELEDLRQQYQHYRATYEYEKKLNDDHYESLQGMDKNYVSMVRELEKLRAGLANAVGYKVNEAGGHQPVGKNAYEDGHNISQGRGGLASPYGEGQQPPARAAAGYDAAPRGPQVQGYGYEAAPKVDGYDAPPPRSGTPPYGSSGYEAPHHQHNRGGSNATAPPSNHVSGGGYDYDAAQYRSWR